jgi:hypothetical protein
MFTFAQNDKNLTDPAKPSSLSQFIENEQYRAFSHRKIFYYVAVKTKELTPKQILSVPCPTCGAATNEPCELHTGDPRTEPHRDRKLSAAEATENEASK